MFTCGMKLKPMTLSTRTDMINLAINRLAERGAANPATATGPVVADLLRRALADDPNEDPAIVIRGILKDLQSTMNEIRNEIRGIDS